MNNSDLKDILDFGKETRRIEFKKSLAWDNSNKEFKAKITKAILGMSNIRDGGIIIIGVEEQNDGSYLNTGIVNDVLASYSDDLVGSFVDVYSDPFVRFEVHKPLYNNDNYVVIKVFEFEEIPVICKKDYTSNNNTILKDGAMYTRSFRIPETIQVPSQSEMREILDMAVEKKVKKHYEMTKRIGITDNNTSLDKIKDDKNKFNDKLRDIK